MTAITNKKITIENIEYDNPLVRALKHPERRIFKSEIDALETEVLELAEQAGEFIVDFEYWKGDSQYNKMIHAYENKVPHIVLKGKNPYDFAIKARSGKGEFSIVGPGQKFKTHTLVDLHN